MLALLLSVGGLSHAGAPLSSISLKAEHILKFAHYVEWPTRAFENPASPIVIGVMGEAALADELARIAVSQQIEGRPVSIKQLAAEDKPAPVHILFVGSHAGSAARDWLDPVETRPRLNICDTSQELGQACAIQFVEDSQRLRFDISVPAAERSGVRIMAPLLTVARKVHK